MKAQRRGGSVHLLGCPAFPNANDVRNTIADEAVSDAEDHDLELHNLRVESRELELQLWQFVDDAKLGLGSEDMRMRISQITEEPVEQAIEEARFRNIDPAVFSQGGFFDSSGDES
jgi:hypothetical protein